jgi:hypothetical protein
VAGRFIRLTPESHEIAAFLTLWRRGLEKKKLALLVSRSESPCLGLLLCFTSRSGQWAIIVRCVAGSITRAQCAIHPTGRREVALRGGAAQATFCPQFASNLDRVEAGLLPPCALIASTVSRPVMDSAERGNEFIAHLSAEGPRLHEAKMVGIAGLSPTHETRLLGDEPEMFLVAVAMRLSNRKGAFVDMFGPEPGRRS